MVSINDAALKELLNISYKNMAGVNPILQDKVIKIITDLYVKHNVRFAAHMGVRTLSQQQALYAQGRSSLEEVNRLRKKAGYGPITAAGNKKVTGVQVSWHNFGVAVDLVEDGDPNKAGIQWSWASIKNYLLIGAIAKSYGLIWGGYWKSIKDYPHVELPMTVTLSEAYQTYLARGVDAVWKKIKV